MSKNDPEADSGYYEPLAVIGDPAAANLLGALLRSEGIPVRLHGETYGPYPVSVGGLAQVEVWVAADRLADARAILEASRSDPEA